MKIFKKNYLKQANKTLQHINKLEEQFLNMSNEELSGYTSIFKNRIAKGEKLDDLLPEAFGVVRESCKRVLGKRPYDVQMIGGIVLHNGQIAEMKTGEGKANPLITPIPTPDGWKTCGDIKEGDMLFDRTGQPTKVIGVYPQGSKVEFDVTLSDGRTVPCANEHLWDVYDIEDPGFNKKTMGTKEMCDNNKLSNGRYYIDLSEPVDYPRVKISKDIFLIGQEIVAAVENENEEKVNSVLAKYSDLLLGSIGQRWDLLDGIARSAGITYVNGEQTFCVNGGCDQFVKFVKELSYSLGLAILCEQSEELLKFTILYNTNGVIEGKYINVVNIEKKRKRKQMVCFEVDNEEHLFLVGDYIVTHNTIVSAAPIYLNALSGDGVHVITVNDYLAERDMHEIGKVLNFLGISTSWIYPNMDKKLKQEAYACDVVYGTNKEFGFDYLRDNMATDKKDLLQRKLNFAIIDEVDSVLIDEARTPLIISGQGTEAGDLYLVADACVSQLRKGETPEEMTQIEMALENMEKRTLSQEEINKLGDYIVDEKKGQVFLTDAGVKKVEEFFGIKNLGDEENTNLSHHIQQALRAWGNMKKDENYIVKNGKVQIVDDFTGRVLDGRRYSDGLHQAIEAKERVEIQKENKTLATISLQNYFRQYKKIAGMTGTAATEEQEFKDIYHMSVVQIPTNLPVIRDDKEDKIFINDNGKFAAILEDISKRHAKGQPILVGTPTIEQSEKVSKLLKENGIKHNLLNAKNNELEAEIIAQAGKKNAVTIATNMAGRGTDIMLGGNPEYLAIKKMRQIGYSDEEIYVATNFIPAEDSTEKELKNEYQKLLREESDICRKEGEEVKKLGGLHVIGTAKHESRRIDNQLKGRAGRQGDPGSSQFFLALTDDVIRIFAGDTLKDMAAKLGIKENEYIDNKQLKNMVTTAQKRFEIKNFDIRKDTLEYDDVNNEQRQMIYRLRSEIVNGKSINVKPFIEYTSQAIMNKFYDSKKNKESVDTINKGLSALINLDNVVSVNMSTKEMSNNIYKALMDTYNAKLVEIKEAGYSIDDIINASSLEIIDTHWIDYITAMQNLREFVSMVGYGSEKPIDVYKKDSYTMFNELMYMIKTDIVFSVLTFQVPQVHDMGTIEVSV